MALKVARMSILETCVLVSIRLVLFFSCRRFVLGNVYLDGHPSRVPNTADYVELDTLPPPSTVAPERPTMSKRALHSSLWRSLFSLCFSECCLLFLMLMCQGLDVLHAGTRLMNWRISLFIILMVVLIVIPLSLSVIFASALSISSTRSFVPSLHRLFWTLTPLFGYFILLSYVPLPVALASSHGSASLLAAALSRLAVLGTVMLGLLSGFGAVSTSWGYFPFVCGHRGKPPTEAQIELAEQGLTRVRTDLHKKREEVGLLERRKTDNATESSSTSWLSRITPNFRADSELSTLKTEISSLTDLEEHMFSQLQWFRQQRAESAFERTLSGRLVVIGRRAMGLYCIFRGLTSILNILLPATKPPAPDAPSRVYPGLLTALMSLVLSDPSTAEAVLRQVNLAIVGIIIWSSVNRVLRGVASALKVTSRAAIKDVVLLVLAQVMGIYLLSTLIQLRTSFPPPAVSNPDATEAAVNLFTTLPAYEFFGPVFDWSFLLAAAGAGVGEWARGKMRTAE